MGEAAAEARREVDTAREELGGTLEQLRTRGRRGREGIVRVAVIAAAGLGTAGGVVAAVVVVRRQRGGALTAAARRLPAPPRGVAVPAARRTERWALRRAERMRRQREELVELLAERVADQQARAERRANPLWRRTAAKGLEAAAAALAAGVARELLLRAVRTPPPVATGTGPGDAELTGARSTPLPSATER